MPVRDKFILITHDGYRSRIASAASIMEGDHEDPKNLVLTKPRPNDHFDGMNPLRMI
jgi:hypothetical protein